MLPCVTRVLVCELCVQLVLFVAYRRMAGSLPFEHWSNLALAYFILIVLSVPSCWRLRISTCLQLTSYQEPGVTGGVRQILKTELFNDSDSLLLTFPLIYCVYLSGHRCAMMLMWTSEDNFQVFLPSLMWISVMALRLLSLVANTFTHWAVRLTLWSS